MPVDEPSVPIKVKNLVYAPNVRRNKSLSLTFSCRINLRVGTMGEQLRIQYDCISKTVLLQLGDNSHVLPEQFDDKDSAENAARVFARETWAYEKPEEIRSKNASLSV
jgi:hypothetical protein